MYQSFYNEYDIPVLTKTVGKMTFTAIDTRKLEKTDLSKLSLMFHDNRAKPADLASFVVKANFIGRNKNFKGHDNNYFNFTKAWSGFKDAVKGAVRAESRTGRSCDMGFYARAKKLFEEVIAENMQDGSCGREKRPEFYTAALIQSKDRSQRSECAVALLIVLDDCFKLIVKVGDMEFGIAFKQVEQYSRVISMKSELGKTRWFSKHDDGMEFDDEEFNDVDEGDELDMLLGL